ncbi:uncharacterized protein LOC117550916 [Gymnodraco acuticeps]|uniref:Uncharacterized protein LOC117550916 n=1 Tax=Gymnodraco acuticeps TaxID=8218 RepID=A0A6P8V2G8_GYMAC|nr:uncharacterized protein LOC117550916 [Gymnodraco acuticeps]
MNDQEEELRSVDTRSRASSHRSSTRSSKSSASAAATRARAKAEAAKIKVSFAEREAAMMRQKAEVEANLYVLKLESKAVAASKEAAIFEAAAADLEEGHLGELQDLAQEDPARRTTEYIDKHSFLQNTHQQFQNVETQKLTSHNNGQQGIHWPHKGADEHKPTEDLHYASLPVSPAFVPNNYSAPTPHTPDLAQYLVRKEMVSSGLLAFDDRPENYWAWKSSFQAVTRELYLSDHEELNLLVKWLGPESAAHAKRIRSVHVHNPTAGVSMIWRRLEECYGCPEVIENALLKRIETFPTTSNKDIHQLRELGDLLLEIDAAKSGGFLPGLAYLDTARGVNPIVEKLPYNLQRWVTQGSRYKEDYLVPFPPFSFFVKFVCAQAKIRNDPSFAFSLSSSQSDIRVDRIPKYTPRTAVSVRKTEVTASASQQVTDKIPPLDTNAPILLLLGRDILRLHKVREQCNGPHNSPYAQRLDLGWVIVGEICLDGTHNSNNVNVYKTHVLQNGRPSFLKPCTNSIQVKERLNGPAKHHLPAPSHSLENVLNGSLDCIGESVFRKTPDDDKPALSVDDKVFLRIMENEVYMDDENHWVAPLPFRFPRKPLPNNREHALQRLSSAHSEGDQT